jgi:DNA-damage-inducible protein J
MPQSNKDRSDVMANGITNVSFQIVAHTPKTETLMAMKEAEEIADNPNIKRYSDVEDALRELKS